MSHMASRTRDNLGRAIVMTMISLTDDGPDRVPLSVGQVHRMKGLQGVVFGRLDVRGGYNIGIFWCRIEFLPCFWGWSESK